ncbi:MAG: superoxide dismutase [Chlorobi bacterium]|nr:superoxide dismutase [Chlorobiota bacterium]
MSFSLPQLRFAADALDPHISQRTIEFHYGKHHQAYVNNLNGLLPGSGFENASLEEIITNASGPVFNNAAQIWNHTFYFEAFDPAGRKSPEGPLAGAIDRDFGDFAAFKDAFTKAAATLFGSGWAWLAKNDQGKLHILQESNAGNPLTQGMTPLLTCDVWEHAYYLDYQNRRPDYIAAFWNLVDWSVVEERF